MTNLFIYINRIGLIVWKREMSDENLMKLTDEINALKEKLDEVEGQNAELIEQIEELTNKNVKLTNQNTKLTEQNSKLMTEIEAMKAEKLQQNDQEQAIPSSPNSSKQMETEEENSTDLENEIDGERPKLTMTRSVPNQNCLIDTLKWLKRKEMADSALSTASRTFNRLCWPKLHGREVKPHCVQRLTTLYEQDSETFQLRAKLGLSDVADFAILPQNYTIIPIANIDPLEYIKGFRQIHLRFLDGQILDFLKIILPSIKKIDIHFLCKIAEWNANNIRICPIRRLLTILAPKISALCLRNDANLCNFNRLFPGFIEEIQHIAIRSRRSDWNVLMKWLNTERADGEPKILSIYIGVERNNFVYRIKQEFLESKRKAAFIIDLGQTNMEDLTLENEETGEILSFYQGGGGGHQYIVRHPKGMEHLRTNWGEKFAIEEDATKIGVEIEEIGLFGTNGDWSPRGKEDDDDEEEDDDDEDDNVDEEEEVDEDDNDEDD